MPIRLIPTLPPRDRFSATVIFVVLKDHHANIIGLRPDRTYPAPENDVRINTCLYHMARLLKVIHLSFDAISNYVASERQVLNITHQYCISRRGSHGSILKLRLGLEPVIPLRGIGTLCKSCLYQYRGNFMLISYSLDISQTYSPIGGTYLQVALISDISRGPYANTLELRLISTHPLLAKENKYTDPCMVPEQLGVVYNKRPARSSSAP
jgi:hypothetical protein